MSVNKIFTHKMYRFCDKNPGIVMVFWFKNILYNIFKITQVHYIVETPIFCLKYILPI